MQGSQIFSDPITRVEGSARIVFVVDGESVRAYYQVLEFRGFEKLAVNRHIEELPRIMSAICGVCSWSHHLASAKAVDMIFGRSPPPRAKLTRILANYIQIIDSHLLHLGIMAFPDLIYWGDGRRDILRLYRDYPEIAAAALKARSIVKHIENKLGGKFQHAALAVPGGISRGLLKDDINEILKWFAELRPVVSTLHKFFDEHIKNNKKFREALKDNRFVLRGLSMGLVRDGFLEFYDGVLKIVDHNGKVVEEITDSLKYAEVIGEGIADWTYAKLPYYRRSNLRILDEASTFIVGPLARLNVADKVYGNAAQSEYGEMIDEAGGKPILNILFYHWARLIEILHSVDAIEDILHTHERELLEGDTMDLRETFRPEGVGILEAPRGTLIHHYRAGENYITTYANIITPTTFNNSSINISLNKVCSRLAKEIKAYGRPEPETLSIVESIIRAYDPCNSCATHCLYLNNMELSISFKLIVINSNGEVLWRSG